MVNNNANPDVAHDEGKVIVAGAKKAARFEDALTGRDIINALAGSALADVTIERLSVKSPVRDIDL